MPTDQASRAPADAAAAERAPNGSSSRPRQIRRPAPLQLADAPLSPPNTNAWSAGSVQERTHDQQLAPGAAIETRRDETPSSDGRSSEHDVQDTAAFAEQASLMGVTPAQLRSLQTVDIGGGESFVGRGGKELWRTLHSHMDSLLRMAVLVPELPRKKSSKRRQEEEYKKQSQPRRCVIMPDSPMQRWWDMAQVVLLLYVAISVPFRVGFNNEVDSFSFVFWFEVVVDCYFILDVFVNFRTSYIDDMTNVITDNKMIARNYILGWFAIDFVSCVPVNYVLLITHDKNENLGAGKVKALKILRLLRLVKMLRLARLKRLMQRHELAKVLRIFTLSGLCLSILYVAHVLCCTWYAVGTDIQELRLGECKALEDPDCPVIKGWVYRMEETWTLDTIGHVANGTETSLSTRYMWSFYFTVTSLSTVGYGDVVPHTTPEVVFTTFLELVGGVVFAILAGTLTAVITTNKISEQKFDMEMAELREFMLQKKIPKPIRREIANFMENFYARATVFDETKVLGKLPPHFRKRLQFLLYSEMILNVPLFSNLGEEVTRRLCMLFQPYAAVRDELIVIEGEVGRELFVVIHGQVQVWKDVKMANARHTSRRPLSILSDGDFFGESCIIRNDSPCRDRTVSALTNGDLAFLTRNDVITVQHAYPELKARLHDFSRRQRKHELETHGAITATRKKSLAFAGFTGKVKQSSLGAHEDSPRDRSQAGPSRGQRGAKAARLYQVDETAEDADVIQRRHDRSSGETPLRSARRRGAVQPEESSDPHICEPALPAEQDVALHDLQHMLKEHMKSSVKQHKELLTMLADLKQERL